MEQREIKFRAWLKLSRMMEYEGLNDYPDGGSVYASKCSLFMYGDTAEIMQYMWLTAGKDRHMAD